MKNRAGWYCHNQYNRLNGKEIKELMSNVDLNNCFEE